MCCIQWKDVCVCTYVCNVHVSFRSFLLSGSSVLLVNCSYIFFLRIYVNVCLYVGWCEEWTCIYPQVRQKFTFLLFIDLFIDVVLTALHIDETGCTLESCSSATKQKQMLCFPRSRRPALTPPPHACMCSICLFVCFRQMYLSFFRLLSTHRQSFRSLKPLSSVNFLLQCDVQ